MKEVFQELQRALGEGLAVVMATVAAVWGATPRRPGARMLVRPDGSCCGTIGGGCAEAEVRAAAMEVFRDGRPRLLRVGLADGSEGEGGECGGLMEVFIERITP